MIRIGGERMKGKGAEADMINQLFHMAKKNYMKGGEKIQLNTSAFRRGRCVSVILIPINLSFRSDFTKFDLFENIKFFLFLVFLFLLPSLVLSAVNHC